MAKDKANIFKLSEEEQKEYKKAPFFDCTPGAEEFAEGLKGMITTKESPYVLLLESPFGMGKTYFCTRLKKYLDNNFHTIYFSVWENDYLPDPFFAFSKAIFEHFKPENEEAEIFKFFEKFIAAIRVGIPNANIDVKTFLDAFIENDPVIEFKEELKKYILNLDKDEKKLLIIVDELDRCRPDYAMKTLEIIKHFFDVEGLYIIVPTNKKSLNKCVLSLYGINEEDNKNTEYYFDKFFNQQLDLYEPDYLKMVEEYVKKESLKEVFDAGRLTTESGKYNSFDLLQNRLANLGKIKKMTIREMTKFCDAAIHYCKQLDCKIYCEYLIYLLCEKLSRNTTDKCDISNEHPFHPNGKKKELLTFKRPREACTLYNTIYEQGFNAAFPLFQNRTFTSYEDFKSFYDEANKLAENGYKFIYDGQDFSNNICTIIIPLLNNQWGNIEAYKAEWDSDNKDEELKKYYEKVVKNECDLYLDE